MHESTAHAFLCCPGCGIAPLGIRAFERDGARVRHGILVCDRCSTWYRIENHVAELLPPSLRDRSRAAAFEERYRDHWTGWREPASVIPRGDSGSALKREQIMFYQAGAGTYDDGIVDSPFWIAFDQSFLGMISREVAPGGVLVEVGAGTGRLIPELAYRHHTVIVTDLSETMIRMAATRRANPPTDAGEVLYLVADAERLPIRSGAAHAVLFAGMLSYLERPGDALREGVRVLAQDGVLVGHENHQGALRPLFDVLTRFMRPWTGKSWPAIGALRRDGIRHMLAAAGFVSRIWTEAFLPPQVFNVLAPSAAGRLLRASNTVFGNLPGLSRQGGLVLFVGRRAA